MVKAANQIPDEVAIQIMHYIKTHEMALGERLPSERELTQLFGVSRASVRQGLSRLEVLGYIDILPGKGAYLKENIRDHFSRVIQLWLFEDQGSIYEIVEMREAIETKAAQLAARRATPEELEIIKTHLTQMQVAIQNEMPEVYMEADKAFHRAIAVASRNRFFHRTLDSIERAMVAYRIVTTYLGTEVLRGSIKGHEQIYAALAAKDEYMAWKAMSDHIASFSRDLRGRAESAAELGVSRPNYPPPSLSRDDQD